MCLSFQFPTIKVGGGGGASRLVECAGWYFRVHVGVRLLRSWGGRLHLMQTPSYPVTKSQSRLSSKGMPCSSPRCSVMLAWHEPCACQGLHKSGNPAPHASALPSAHLQAASDPIAENCGEIAGKCGKMAVPSPNLRKPQRAPLLYRAPTSTQGGQAKRNCRKFAENCKVSKNCEKLRTSIPLCDIPSGCCFFTGPWTVTRSSLRMLRQVAAFCWPLRPVLLLVSFPSSRSPVVGVLGLC